MKLLTVFLMALLATTGCQTTSAKKDVKRFAGIKLNMQTPSQLAIDIAAERGGLSIDFVSQLLKKRNAWQKVEPALRNRIEANRMYSQVERFNLAKLYQTKPGAISTETIQKLLASSDLFYNKIGWYLSAAKPSPKVALAVDQKLSRILENGKGEELHEPLLAAAISSNQMTSAYSILRRSLLETGTEQFAEAMISLRPRQASEDFLDYLALAPVEELRQLTIKSVNVTTCNIILNHLRKFPPQVQSTKFTTLFLYSVARNRILSQLASDVLEVTMSSQDRRYLAALLGRSPEWLQVAYVENARHDMTARKKLFLNDLKNITPHEDVVYEISASIR